MKILVINAGSSSLKYQLIDMENESLLAKGLCERIGIDGRLQHKPQNGKPVFEAEMNFPTHQEAIEAVLEKLVSKEYGVVESMSEIGAVGHRVLHGGNEFTKSCLVDDACEEAIKKCFPLGPLHNPANLMGIKACQAVMPGTPQVAVFDTSFGMDMAPQAYMYALPYEYYEQDAVRRYGFHGTSHRFVSARANELMNKPGCKVINAHLGNGSSLSASIDGKCVDTAMGLTPLAGVPMGTRSGDVDPSILQYLMSQHGYSIDEMLNILNKKSGVLGISGVSSDFRDLDAAAAEGNERAQLALDKFAYEVKKYIGAYIAAMGGCDILTFTAGVGENSSSMRARICEGLECFGIKLDPELNEKRGDERKISAADSKVEVWVIPTNEELMIARDTLALVK
ncbi:MAG: acetate kinase [Clostridiales bacterium]|nr:acetate kinase [Candidatus Apopatocola equi]MCQ2439092.1 acetate kinase [Oscillospiraceae bacterium]